jgi:hypothetical protein
MLLILLSVFLMADQVSCRCVCGKTFKSAKGFSLHQSRYCTGPPTEHAAAGEHAAASSSAAASLEATAGDADQAHAEDGEGSTHARDLYMTAFKGLTGLRLLYNASNAQVQAVRDLVSNLMAPIRAELTRRFAALIPADESAPLPDLSALIGSATDAFRGLQSAYMEQKARAALLPDLLPKRRVLGTRQESTDLPDGRTIFKDIEDVVYDYDVLKHLEAIFEHSPEKCADFLASFERWLDSNATEISDTCHGRGFAAQPLLRLAMQHGRFPVFLHYYMDGIGLTSPLGMASSSRKVAISYVVVVNFSAEHRTSEHSIIPVSLCYEKDWSRYDEADIVCGPCDEPEDGTSFGAQMRRLGDPARRTMIRVPSQFASHPYVETVRQPDQTTLSQCCGCGGVGLVSADSPAGGQLFGTKIAFGPSTVSICRLCYCKQVDGANRSAHCVPNSFLPWAAGSGSDSENGSGLFAGLVCTDASLTSEYDPNRMGAMQVHKLRTVQSTSDSMKLAMQLDDAQRAFYMQSIGVRSYSHAFSRVPYSQYVDSGHDLMHVELLELITCHLSKLLWKFHRELGWIRKMDHYNTRVRSFEHWSRGSRKSVYTLSEDALKGSLEECSIGGLWTAHHAMIFMVFSVQLLDYFVPADQKDHPVWRCWCLHHRYFMMLLQRSFTLTDIRTIDVTIFTMQTLYLEIYGILCWLPKFHFAQHFPVRLRPARP